MQELIYRNVLRGTSKKGNEYDMTEVSDGLDTFTLSNGKGVADELINSEIEEGQPFLAEVHVSTKFGGLRGTIMKVDIPQ